MANKSESKKELWRLAGLQKTTLAQAFMSRRADEILALQEEKGEEAAWEQTQKQFSLLVIDFLLCMRRVFATKNPKVHDRSISRIPAKAGPDEILHIFDKAKTLFANNEYPTRSITIREAVCKVNKMLDSARNLRCDIVFCVDKTLAVPLTKGHTQKGRTDAGKKEASKRKNSRNGLGQDSLLSVAAQEKIELEKLERERLMERDTKLWNAVRDRPQEPPASHPMVRRIDENERKRLAQEQNPQCNRRFSLRTPKSIDTRLPYETVWIHMVSELMSDRDGWRWDFTRMLTLLMCGAHPTLDKHKHLAYMPNNGKRVILDGHGIYSIDDMLAVCRFDEGSLEFLRDWREMRDKKDPDYDPTRLCYIPLILTDQDITDFDSDIPVPHVKLGIDFENRSGEADATIYRFANHPLYASVHGNHRGQDVLVSSADTDAVMTGLLEAFRQRDRKIWVHDSVISSMPTVFRIQPMAKVPTSSSGQRAAPRLTLGASKAITPDSEDDSSESGSIEIMVNSLTSETLGNVGLSSRSIKARNKKKNKAAQQKLDELEDFLNDQGGEDIDVMDPVDRGDQMNSRELAEEKQRQKKLRELERMRRKPTANLGDVNFTPPKSVSLALNLHNSTETEIHDLAQMGQKSSTKNARRVSSSVTKQQELAEKELGAPKIREGSMFSSIPELEYEEADYHCNEQTAVSCHTVIDYLERILPEGVSAISVIFALISFGSDFTDKQPYITYEKCIKAILTGYTGELARCVYLFRTPDEIKKVKELEMMSALKPDAIEPRNYLRSLAPAAQIAADYSQTYAKRIHLKKRKFLITDINSYPAGSQRKTYQLGYQCAGNVYRHVDPNFLSNIEFKGMHPMFFEYQLDPAAFARLLYAARHIAKYQRKNLKDPREFVPSEHKDGALVTLAEEAQMKGARYGVPTIQELYARFGHLTGYSNLLRQYGQCDVEETIDYELISHYPIDPSVRVHRKNIVRVLKDLPLLSDEDKKFTDVEKKLNAEIKALDKQIEAHEAKAFMEDDDGSENQSKKKLKQ